MKQKQVVVTTPSRLHFGLLRFAQPEGRSYGGLGMMIRQPRVTVRVRRSAEWEVVGPGASRALAAAQRVARQLPGLAGEHASIAIEALPPRHAGLGVGTQLALAVAQGMRVACGSMGASAEGAPPTAELAAAAGRAHRSAVGAHGFVGGGLIYESGYLPGEQVGQLVSRTPMPAAWRVVLLRLPHAAGISGAAEAEAFAQLAPPPAEFSIQLERLAGNEILPAARAADFARFGEAVYQYGALAGQCFASVQGGPFATPAIAEAVGRLRDLGVRGVGQSSWGPTIYAFCESDADADRLLAGCRSDSLLSRAQLEVTAADNQGASTTVASP